MLKRVAKRSVRRAAGKFAIVASQYNAKYVDSMVKAARVELASAGVTHIEVVRVPGAYEIPVVAGHFARARAPRYEAVICFGVVLRGATTHAQHIGDAVSLTLAQLAAETGVPVIHGVYLFENEEQARARCLDPKHNRGLEGARTALAMSRVIRGVAKEG
jgi:6,7-dimethyl-8-ribityllumazine synthase